MTSDRTCNLLKQGQHPDPLDPRQPRPDAATWPNRQKRAFASPKMQAYRAALLLQGESDVRQSVLDDLSTFYGFAPQECVQRCVDWERWSVEEWRASKRD